MLDTSYTAKMGAIGQQYVYCVCVLTEKFYHHYVLAVNRNKEKALLKTISRPLQKIDLTGFGKILLSGKGKQPDERAIQMLRDRYAIEINLQAAI